MNLSLSEVADWISIVSFVLTIWIAVGVRKIQRRYLFVARVPNLTKDITKLASTISEQLGDFEKAKDASDVTLASMEPLLNSLKKKLDRQGKASVERVLKTIGEYQNGKRNQESLRQVYIETQRLIAEVAEITADSKWEN